MRIGVIGAVPFNLIFGGGETQLINTMKALREIGVDIDYYNMWDKEYTCDILHIFGCHHWLYQWASLAKQKGIKLVLSTISYSDTKMTFKRRLYKYIDSVLPVDTIYGLNRKLIQISDILLPNSEEECRYLDNIMGATDKKKMVIPNATDLRYKYGTPDAVREKYGLENYVLCVGKIEPRKNQLNLVKALKGTDIPLVLLGSFIPNNKAYFDEVCSIVAECPNMHYIDFLPYDSDLLASLYAGAKVHALLGESETPGIVNLEAGLAGASLVVGDCMPVREYLKGYATYVDYKNITAIREAIVHVYYDEKQDEMLSDFIRDNYTWDIVAKKTLEAYQAVLE